MDATYLTRLSNLREAVARLTTRFRGQVTSFAATRGEDGRLVVTDGMGGTGILLTDEGSTHYNVWEWSAPKGYRMTPHWHQLVPVGRLRVLPVSIWAWFTRRVGIKPTEILVVLQGQCTLRIYDTCVPKPRKKVVDVGNCVAFPANAVHLATFTDNTKLLVMFLPAHSFTVTE